MPTLLVSAGPAQPTADGGYAWPNTFLSNFLVNLVWISVTFGCACGIQAFRRTPPGSAARAKAKAYLIAFATIDVSLVGMGIPYNLTSNMGAPEIVPWLFETLQALGIAVGPLLLVRGMLRYQLFDFDVKVKKGLQRGTVAAIILGAAIIAAQVAQNFFANALGWLAGGAVAGLLFFAIKPIERFAERLSDHAMPRTTGTPEYFAARKHEIYRAALEDSLADGAVTAKERAVLVRLAANLELDGNDAMRIEGEVLASRGAA
jgi:hypothetical protein